MPCMHSRTHFWSSGHPQCRQSNRNSTPLIWSWNEATPLIWSWNEPTPLFKWWWKEGSHLGILLKALPVQWYSTVVWSEESQTTDLITQTTHPNCVRLVLAGLSTYICYMVKHLVDSTAITDGLTSIGLVRLQEPMWASSEKIQLVGVIWVAVSSNQENTTFPHHVVLPNIHINYCTDCI